MQPEETNFGLRISCASLVASAVALILAGAAQGAGTGPVSPWPVGSKWQITITDHERVKPQVVTLRVTAEKARSCLGGDWLRLRRVGGSYDRLSEPAYRIEGNHVIVLLASDVCDAYDQVEGEVSNKAFKGKHSEFGLGGSTELGTATAVRLE